MTLTNWNWTLPPELQDVAWDCAAASLTWCLNTVRPPWTEADVVKLLGPTRISEYHGLLDASGAGIVDALAEIGIGAANNAQASWQEIIDAAGYQPMLMGGRAWYHWTGVRISSVVFDPSRPQEIALANPAPGYMGITQHMDEMDFDELGPFSAVWFTSW